MRRDYKRLIKESEAELEALEAKHRNSVIGTRLRLLKILKTGEETSVERAAQKVHYSELGPTGRALPVLSPPLPEVARVLLQGRISGAA